MDIGEKIERLLSRNSSKKAAAFLSRRDRKSRTLLGEVMRYYGQKRRPISAWLKYWPYFLLISVVLKKLKVSQKAKERVFTDPLVRRAIVNTARSLGQYGLTKPQVFSAPLLVVWNFTNRCNLSCVHCYQDARRDSAPSELPLEKQLRIIDELVDNYTVLLAISGGEPLLVENFWKVSSYAAKRGLHVSVATNGTLLTKDNVQRLIGCGVRYLEVSLDSVKPERHDKFRGAGCWQKTVSGIKEAVAAKMKVGLAPTITRLNFGELEDLIKFAIGLGCNKLCAFNFVPTGRAKEIVDLDLTPEMREEMLSILYRYLNEGRIDIMTTSPQISRTCVESAYVSSALASMATAHVAAGKGNDVRLFAKYMGGCGAGRCYCAIQPDGVVTPCVFMRLKVGDLREQSLMDIWQSSEIFKVLRDRDDRKGHCAICDYKLYCGGCRARPYNYFGEIRESDPGCLRNKDRWEKLKWQTSHSQIFAEEN